MCWKLQCLKKRNKSPDRYGWRYNKDCSGEFGPENNGEDPKGLGTGFVNDAIELPTTIELTPQTGVVEGDVEADVTKEGLDSETKKNLMMHYWMLYTLKANDDLSVMQPIFDLLHLLRWLELDL